jgi:hypothetical protein
MPNPNRFGSESASHAGTPTAHRRAPVEARARIDARVAAGNASGRHTPAGTAPSSTAAANAAVQVLGVGGRVCVGARARAPRAPPQPLPSLPHPTAVAMSLCW